MITPLRYSIRNSATILFLFTKSDLKTIFFPTIAFAIASTSQVTSIRLCCAAIWVWFNLLQFCISNQSLAVDEDRINKPWRPIAASLIDVRTARILRWGLLIVCLLMSIRYHVVGPGGLLAVGIWVNNELKYDSYWITRHLLCALGYYAFGSGATAIINGGTANMTATTADALSWSALVVMTTIHAQDFCDEDGDRTQGRLTLPIVAPVWSRISMLATLLVWSAWLIVFCALGMASSCFLVGSGLAVGCRFLLLKDQRADHRSYIYYNVWLSAAQIALLNAPVRVYN